MAPEQLRPETVAGEPVPQVTFAWKAIGAFLGVAVGDALGWPQERGTRAPGGIARPQERNEFRSWTRQAGGRYLLHDETVLAGEYSDDTQLPLATARSLLESSTWWRQFALRELPGWSVLERGGGGATKRAAAAWTLGTAPWEQRQSTDISSYFRAGGNGVAMRVMPHAIRHARSEEFEQVAREVVANGVCTHGHPRALVGALAFAFGVWQAFRHVGTLGYGGLIDATIDGAKSWGRLPDIAPFWPTWREAAETSLSDYEVLWDGTVQEMLDLLAATRKGIELGALAVDREVLSRIGAFDKKVNGAGTITTAAALFLASRYAPDPILGVLEAAFAEGADTDTVASMTGALLGALGGSDWLAGYARQVQDADYLQTIASKLATMPPVGPEAPGVVTPITKSQLDEFKKRIESSCQGDPLELPEGTRARITQRVASSTRTGGTDAELIRLVSDKGQTFHIKTFRGGGKRRENEPRGTAAQVVHGEGHTSTQVIRVGVKLPVEDVVRSRDFYERVLGLTVIGEQPSLVRFGGGVSLTPRELHGTSNALPTSVATGQTRLALTIFIETVAVDDVYTSVVRQGAKVVRPLTESSARRFFQCEDPDGNVVEVFDRKLRVGSDASRGPSSHDPPSERDDRDGPLRANVQTSQTRPRPADTRARSSKKRSGYSRTPDVNLPLPETTL